MLNFLSSCPSRCVSVCLHNLFPWQLLLSTMGITGDEKTDQHVDEHLQTLSQEDNWNQNHSDDDDDPVGNGHYLALGANQDFQLRPVPPQDLEWNRKVDMVQQLINQTLMLSGDGGLPPLLLLPVGTGGTLSPLESSLWPDLQLSAPPLLPPSPPSAASPRQQGQLPPRRLDRGGGGNPALKKTDPLKNTTYIN
ncbi:hypothetical protein F7725_003906 [Dissostichus mawsoni]|uniref:Uncharacterized protein n=1 Tax=Dissostichus mawsoni TaxID=36200 RepID=A0A7J5YEV1_DISMA|nr:hypothetical protein F7725_003906 [Dissostichus mawsoni]